MLRRHFGKILVVLAVASLTLGITGFLNADPATCLATAFYRSVQLFYRNYFPWNTSAEAVLPWMLEVARWLAPLTTLGAISRVALAVFHKKWDAFRAGRQRGHALITGAGEKGLTLARDLVERGWRVVFVEGDARLVDELAGEGFLAVHGEASNEDVLRRCGAREARVVVASGGIDHDNLAVAMSASRAGAPSVIAHCGDPALSDLYRRHSALASPEPDAGEVRICNAFRNLARLTLAAHPPRPDSGEITVVLPELEDRGLALIVEYALMGHFPDDKRVRLILAGPRAAMDRELIVARYPRIGHCMDLACLPAASDEMFSSRVADLVAESTGDFTIFPSLTDANTAFSRALQLLESIRDRAGFRILLPASPDSPVQGIVGQNPALLKAIGFLPGLEEACGFEAVIAESLDRVARTIHENWILETRRQIDAARAAGNEGLARAHEAKETFRPWDSLTEEQKGASRSQADHIPFKIRAAGFDSGNVSRQQWEALDDGLVEKLARVEHARWAAYYWMTGWVYGAERNDRTRQHPNLVAYEALDEPTREYDRAAVRNVARFLAER